jgi:DNA-3-methyladenine glycosylase I
MANLSWELLAWSRSGESRRNPRRPASHARIRYARRMSGYCDFAPGHPLHGPYHDHEYGFPQRDEAALFERLLLEINQAGLSWETILKKRGGFRVAYDGFDVDTVAAYGEKDRVRLLADAGIIRNRMKIDAAIHNAGVIRGFRDSHGGFAAWLDAQMALDGKRRDKDAWVKLFKQTFKFTGGEITGEFLMSLGYLPGAHHTGCPTLKRIAEARGELGI